MKNIRFRWHYNDKLPRDCHWMANIEQFRSQVNVSVQNSCREISGIFGNITSTFRFLAVGYTHYIYISGSEVLDRTTKKCQNCYTLKDFLFVASVKKKGFISFSSNLHSSTFKCIVSLSRIKKNGKNMRDEPIGCWYINVIYLRVLEL